ncbi:hypothetical protein V5R04_15805 [Jonesiaceae bacterium BS-20]|uniref:Uncharacterized protein n=1 Tax=Jonesiaceae bacterium BS-20 TaxID=3120821 RepID=A0AAU7DX71_9MICO
MGQSAESDQPGGDVAAADTAGSAGTPKKRVTPEIPERLALLQQKLVEAEVAVIVARRNRNIEVAKLRDEAKMSQYRISKWLGVTERAVMLMAKQGREF